jgi:hypothetical protein
VKRSPRGFTGAILPRLLVVPEIHFLDRGFNVDGDSLYTRNYRAILKELAVRCEVFPVITIHCCPDVAVDLAYFEGELIRHYANLIPHDKARTCVVWQVSNAVERGAHPFHNRFVLTSLCGAIVGYGTDSPNIATDAPDTLQILDRGLFSRKLQQSRDRKHPLISVRRETQILGIA